MKQIKEYLTTAEISAILSCSIQYARRLCSGRYYNLNGVKRYYPPVFRDIVVNKNYRNRPKMYVNKLEVIKYLETRKCLK